MTIHICSGNDPNDGKGVGNYQAEKNDIGLEVVFFSSKNDQGVLILNYYPWINSGFFCFLFSNWCDLRDKCCNSVVSQNPPTL